MIPVHHGREAAEVMRAAGAKLTHLETPVPHTVDPAWISDLQRLVAGAIDSA